MQLHIGESRCDGPGDSGAEIAHSIQQAATGTQQVSSHIVGVTAAADESGKTAKDVLGSTERLTAQSEALGGEIDRFLSRIKAAYALQSHASGRRSTRSNDRESEPPCRRLIVEQSAERPAERSP